MKCYIFRTHHSNRISLSEFGKIQCRQRLLLDRDQTKENLCKRNIVIAGSGIRYAFCQQLEETSNHLFFNCNFFFFENV